MVLAYQVLNHFIVPVSWAAILVYITWPAYVRLRHSLGGRRTMAACAMTLFLTSIIIAPLIWVSILSRKELTEFFHSLPEWLERKPELPAFAYRVPYFGTELSNLVDQFDDLRALIKDKVAPWVRQFSGNLLTLLGDVGLIAAQIGLTLLTAFFFYRDGREIIGQVRSVLRLALGARLESYFATAQATMKAVVYGIVLTALAQGTLAGLGYWSAGIRAPIILGVVTAFFALIPFGTPFVWGSASLWLLAKEEYWSGIGLGLWGTFVVSWVDNIVRPLVISGATRIPFLLVFFGVLGGLAHFGLIGLFLGPVVLAISLAVWREWLGQHSDNKP